MHDVCFIHFCRQTKMLKFSDYHFANACHHIYFVMLFSTMTLVKNVAITFVLIVGNFVISISLKCIGQLGSGVVL